MSNLDPPAAGWPAVAPRQRFALTVQPATPQHAWRAWLQADGGPEIGFDSPIELLRHLAQLGATQPLPGTLK